MDGDVYFYSGLVDILKAIPIEPSNLLQSLTSLYVAPIPGTTAVRVQISSFGPFRSLDALSTLRFQCMKIPPCCTGL